MENSDSTVLETLWLQENGYFFLGERICMGCNKYDTEPRTEQRKKTIFNIK